MNNKTLKFKYIVNLITISRIFGAFSLLLIVYLVGLSPLFYIIYTLCIFTDILDGYIARKTGTIAIPFHIDLLTSC